MAVVWGCLGMLAPLSAAEVSHSLQPNRDVLSLLADLDPNQSAYLPKASLLGDFNDEARRYNLHRTGPGKRNFCSRMAWAPDRERAFYAGANHGVPHRLNDIWEYDLAANTWYLLYAPDPSVGRGNREAYEAVREYREHEIRDSDGKPVETVTLRHTNRGGPAGLGHTYWGMAYDPKRKALLWKIPRANQGGSYEGIPVWAFYPAERRWEPILSMQPRPGAGGISALEYVEDLGGMVRYSASWQAPGMWTLSSRSNLWNSLTPNDGVRIRGCDDCPGSTAVFAYHQEARLLVAVEEHRTYHYQVDDNRWIRVAGDNSDMPVGHYGNSVFGHDPKGDVFLLYTPGSDGEIWAYDYRNKEWTARTPDGPAPPKDGVIGYVDPERGVLVLNRDREVWVYRYGGN